MRSEDFRQKPKPSDVSDWTEQVELLLKDWHRRVYAAQTAHYASADKLRMLNYLIGVPAAILSSIVGTAIFAGLEKESAQTYIVASISILTAVLAGLQTFLRFSERAVQHATAGDWYSAVRRDLEATLHLPVEFRGRARDCLDRFRKEMNRVVQDSPELRGLMWRREAKRFGVLEPMDPMEPI
jgi:hypothetical protein